MSLLTFSGCVGRRGPMHWPPCLPGVSCGVYCGCVLRPTLPTLGVAQWGRCIPSRREPFAPNKLRLYHLAPRATTAESVPLGAKASLGNRVAAKLPLVIRNHVDFSLSMNEICLPTPARCGRSALAVSQARVGDAYAKTNCGLVTALGLIHKTSVRGLALSPKVSRVMRCQST